MKEYLEAHDAFVNWLNGAAECEPTAAEVERAMFELATCAANRGMADAHWIFVVDGLIAHAKRRCPENSKLPDYIARGLDFARSWPGRKVAAPGRTA